MTAGLQLGLELRDEAMERVDNPPWRAFADRALLSVARTYGVVTSEDVWQELDRMGIPRPAEARCMGPCMAAAVKAETLEPTGYQRSSDPRHHADVMRVYRSRLLP